MASPFRIVWVPRSDRLAGGIDLDDRSVATENELPALGELDFAVLEAAASTSPP
ncbi:MAG: hypothetical protein ABSE58_08680 [Candidatus Limnocylindrales bacterium]